MRTVAAAVVLLLTPSILTADVLPVPPGWYSGDAHVHWASSCNGVSPPEDILAAMPWDLTFASVLIWCGGDTFDKDAEAYFSGRADSPVSTPTQIVHYDLEVSACGLADQLGHGVYLYLDTIDFPQSTYNGPIQDWARLQGAVVGFDHSQMFAWHYGMFPPSDRCCTPYEVPVSVALGRVDFLSFQPNQHTDGWRFLYYTLLDCGFRPGLVASSDSFCHANPIGSKRTYARIEGPPTYGNWVAALAAGRVSTVEDYNNFLHFTVNGAEAGDEVAMTAGTTVNLQARVSLPDGVLRSGQIEIVRNQEVVAIQPYYQSGGEVVLNATDIAQESSWYAARTYRSHTGAVFAIVDDRPIRSSIQSAQYYVDYMDWFTGLVEADSFPQLTEKDAAALLSDIAQARVVYQRIRTEAEGPVAVPEPVPSSSLVSVVPNPSRANASFSFPVDDPASVAIEIFRSDGRLVRRLSGASGSRGAGRIDWDGRDSGGHPAAAGVYLYRVSTSTETIGEGKLVRVH